MGDKSKISENAKIYLDNNATTKLEPEVIDKMVDAATHAWGNPSSQNQQGVLAKQIIETARQNIATMLGTVPRDVIFTSGGTESNHLVILSAIKRNNVVSKPKPHVITSVLEHDSVKLLLNKLRDDAQIELSEVGANPKTARVEVDDVLGEIRPNTRLITIMLANNETGVFQPVKGLFQRVSETDRQKNPETRIWLHTDAAQVIGKEEINLQDLNTDYLTIVGHKFYGPRIGALYVRDLEKGVTPLKPMFYGGGQERGYRPGTENTPMIAGLGEAARIVHSRLSSIDRDHMEDVRDYLESRLEQTFRHVVVNGRCSGSTRLCNTSNVSIIIDGGAFSGRQILADCERLQAGVGAACHSHGVGGASAILLASGVPEDAARCAVRLSVGRHTSKRDVDVAVQDLQNSVQKLLPAAKGH